MAIPVGSLSFKDYMQGCRLAWRSARKRRYWVSPLLIGVASGLAFCFLYYLVCEYLFVMKGFNLFFSGWFDSAEEAEFRVFNARILLIFIYTFFMGYFVRFVLQRLVNKKNHRRIYLANDSIREGYSLELTDKGIRCANRLAGSHISWQKVRGVTSSGEMDFILIGSGMFLWIPSALEGTRVIKRWHLFRQSVQRWLKSGAKQSDSSRKRSTK